MRHFRFIIPALLTLLLFFTLQAKGNSFLPIITNYSASEYKGGLQNWACAQGPNGDIYIGNNLGLLSFDGAEWQLHEMPTQLNVRSILIDNERIYVGSYNEFGYFEKDQYGQFIYYSLQDKLKHTVMHDDDIWNIVKQDNTIYFQSFSSWFTYEANEVKAYYHEKFHPLYFHKAHNNIYVQAVNGDFFILKNNTPHLLFAREAVGDDNIVAIIEKEEGKILLCTEWNGLFLFDGKKVEQWHTDIDPQLKKIQLNRATTTKKDSSIILGSIRDGIYAIDKEGKLKWNYNTAKKLYNNSVLRLFCDDEDNIWAALDNGISLIHTGIGFSILEPRISDFSLGMVYGIELVNEDIYIATNNGAYIFDRLTNKIRSISNTEGQNWHISQFESQLLIGNNAGTKTILNQTAHSIANNSGGSTCIRKCRINDQEVLLESSYSSLRVYKFIDGKWVLANLIANFSAPIRQFEVDHTGTIWASHMNKGLYRLTLSNDLTKLSTQKYYPNISTNLKGSTLFVTKIRGRIVISGANDLYTYDDLSQSIIPFTQLNEIHKNGIISATMIDDNTFWVANKEGYALINYANNRYNLLQTIRATYFGTECNETNNNVFVKDSSAYFYLNNAIGYYADSNHKSSKKLKRELVITSAVTTSQTNKEVLPLVTSTSNRANSLRYIEFSVSYPDYSSDHISYNYKLEGGGNKIETTSIDNSIFFSNLNFGNYTFKCTALNDKGEELSTKTYYFSVVRPFYLSFLAILLYIVTFIVTAYWWAKVKANKAMKTKQKEYEADKIKQNIQLLEQEKIIAEQQKQLLSTELALRSKENASLALDLLARDKAIESFKELITEHRRNSSMSQKEAELLLSKFNQKFGSHEFLDIYQKNFDLIHENFFRNLRTSYPTLTSSDLKFCALLRLNLSTKDISQFTNLTIRGVEAARYRIRKKMEIAEGVNLVDFLIDFKG